MFSKDTYTTRRNALKKQVGSGIHLFPGNGESPMNYPANTYSFRQDSSFLYYFGIDLPGLTAVIDADSGDEFLFGYDFTIDDIVWMGPQPTMADLAASVGIARSGSLEDLNTFFRDAATRKRTVHFLPPYRGETVIQIADLLSLSHGDVHPKASMDLIRAVVAQRSVKSNEEIAEMEKALAISYDMYRLAMKVSKPGLYEYEVYGAVEGLALGRASHTVSFPVIFTSHGEILHGHDHSCKIEAGDILVLDSGAESPLHYASDITRTYPVSGQFTDLQKDIYNIVFAANENSITMIKPGIPYRDVHLAAARTIADGMKGIGFMKGNMEDAVAAGAHAMFFPHGLGHMIGLDVHDMEGLGEDNVGYDEEFKRSDQFGTAYLRLGKRLQPGYAITVEPGIYFMPELVKLWKSEKKFVDFIDYEKVEKHLDFRGMRIEDDVLVTDNGCRVLGKPIAKSVEDVEAWCQA